MTPGFGDRLQVAGPTSRARLPVGAGAPHLAAAHDVRVLRQQIHHLPFAFVAPLRAEHHRHPVPSGPRPGPAAVAVGQGGCCRVGLGQRHDSSDARRARGRGGPQRVRERNCSAARSHMQRKRQPAAAPPRPRPLRAAASAQDTPRCPPRPAQGGTVTAPLRPAAAAPPGGRGPAGRNRRCPESKPRPFQGRARHSPANPRPEAAGAGLRARASLNAPPTLPGSCFSNWRARRYVLQRRTTTPGMQRSELKGSMLVPECLPWVGFRL